MPKLENRNTKLESFAERSLPRVRDFTGLQVWPSARELRREANVRVRGFPSDERYAPGQQMRCALTSIPANMAERFGRYSFQEDMQFCRLARNSAYDGLDHLTIAHDQGYMALGEYKFLDLPAQRLIQTRNSYIRSTQARRKASAIQKP